MSTVKLTRKRILLGLVLCLLVFGGGAAAWVALNSDKPDEKTTGLAPVDDVQIAALKYAENNNIDDGLAYFDDQIEQRQDEDEKKQLLIYKANFAQQAERFDDAIVAAKQADEISSDISTTVSLARAYEAQGDRNQALMYYKRVLELSPKDDGMGARYNPVWEEKIRELE